MIELRTPGPMCAAAGAIVGLSAIVAFCADGPTQDAPAPEKAESSQILTSIAEARSRAKLLHETIHSTLRAVHHDYYRDDEGLKIPAVSLKYVFDALERRQNVKLHWLAVDTEPMNADHKASGDFEKAAVKALASGEDSHETTDPGVYRHVGVIVLSSECLGCHLPARKSAEDRAAGLVIEIPVRHD